MSPSHNSAKPFSYNVPSSPTGQRRSSDLATQYSDAGSISGTSYYNVPNVPGQYEPAPMQSPHYTHNQSNVRQPASPKFQRQSSGSPKLTRKHSDRGRLIPVEALSHPVASPTSPPNHRTHGPPSFPAPPPPLNAGARFAAGVVDNTRSPSPPLPPPPPEMVDSRGKPLSPQSSLRQRAMQSALQITQQPSQPIRDEPPTPPPISKIPGTRSSVSSFELGKKLQRGDSSEDSPLQSPTHYTQPTVQSIPHAPTHPGQSPQHVAQPSGLAAQLNKVKLRSAPVNSGGTNVVPGGDINRNFKEDAKGIAAEIGQIKLRSTAFPVENGTTENKAAESATDADVGKIKLNPVRNTGERTVKISL